MSDKVIFDQVIYDDQVEAVINKSNEATQDHLTMKSGQCEGKELIQCTSTNTCSCPCGVLTAEIEGMKLDLVILQKIVEGLDSSRNRAHMEVEKLSKLKQDLINANQCQGELKQRLADQNIEILNLSTKVRSLEETKQEIIEERDSLKTALTLVTQDLNQVSATDYTENNKSNNIDEVWQTVKTRKKSKVTKPDQPSQQCIITKQSLKEGKRRPAMENYAEKTKTNNIDIFNRHRVFSNINDNETAVQRAINNKINQNFQSRKKNINRFKHSLRSTDQSVCRFRVPEWLGCLPLIETPPLKDSCSTSDTGVIGYGGDSFTGYQIDQRENESEKRNRRKVFRVRTISQRTDWLKYLEFVRRETQ